MYRLIIKSTIDLCVSLVALIVLFPIILGATLLLFIVNDGKPFFFQIRPGKNGRLFKIIKFKTMNDKKDSEGNLLSDEYRLTKIGAFVRKTSLDEIPQLLNVLKGDMSLIGPRPLLPEYLPLYNESQRRRHEVKPGITGWAQVNGRNAISWEQKFEYDVWYVENVSFLLDLKILYQTIKKVFKREGITAENSVSAEAFKGNSL
jgi:lipopolysaccharide/colanic/teichoic acid biosynthesis glycosyltransferase